MSVLYGIYSVQLWSYQDDDYNEVIKKFLGNDPVNEFSDNEKDIWWDRGEGLMPDMQKFIIFTPSTFEAKQIYPKKCVIFGNTKFATKQRKLNNKIK